MAEKRTRVARVAPKVIATNENPTVSRLTERERRVRHATTTTTGFRGDRGIGMSNVIGTYRSITAADVMDSGAANFYSPQLSTDFLEKPQNLRERRAFYRFFYRTNEIVRRAIDLHTMLPLSKLRLVPPKGKNKHQNEYIFKFFEEMCNNIKLFKTLKEMSFEFNLIGNGFFYCQESDWEENLTAEEIAKKKFDAEKRKQFLEQKYEIHDKDPLYKGWSKIIVLPPDQVRLRKLPLTDDVAVEFMPDPETRKFLTSDVPVDPTDPARKYNYSIPQELREKVRQSGVIPLETDPYTGSHVYHMANKKSQYEPMGTSVIECCMNTIILLDKLRQAQTSIASRHMTPMRIVWAEDLAIADVDNLREQVDMALVDPDFSIIANYEIHWEEMGSQGRLLDIEAQVESGLNMLFAGLGVTRELLTGEGTYTGSRISLEIMNNQYLEFREEIQEYVENYIFKPVAKKKGFIEIDEYGNEILLYPKLSFTRLAIRDNEQYFDAIYQLYQKGSVSIDIILDLLNIDPESTKTKIEKDLFTVNDSIFNELMRNIYTNAATALIEKTDITEKLADYLKLEITQQAAPAEGSSRFSSDKKADNEVEVVDDEKSAKIAKIAKYLASKPELIDKIFEKLK